MQQKAFFLTVGALFAAVSALHFLRMAFAWDAVIGGWSVPMWLSAIAFVVSLFLSYQSFRFAKKSGLP